MIGEERQVAVDQEGYQHCCFLGSQTFLERQPSRTRWSCSRSLVCQTSSQCQSRRRSSSVTRSDSEATSCIPEANTVQRSCPIPSMCLMPCILANSGSFALIFIQFDQSTNKKYLKLLRFTYSTFRLLSVTFIGN